MKVRRDIASVPLRTAGETWEAFTDLITGPGSVDTETLKVAASVMESLIVDEHAATNPIVVTGKGPRLVVYLLYNEAAMEAGKDVDSLSWNPTANPDWAITAPAEAGDVDWMNNTLRSRAPRITVHDAATSPSEDDEAGDATGKDQALKINWGVLDRP